MKTLLFTGGGGVATMELYRWLSDRYVVHFADANPDKKPPELPADRWHVIPYAFNPNGLGNLAFVPSVAELCRTLQVDLLIPGVDEELRALSRPFTPGRPELPCPVLLPDFDFICTHLDKLRSMKTLADRGIPVPRTRRLRPHKGARDWPPFPCILKPREGRGSRDVAVVQSVEDGEACVQRSALTPCDFLVQERLVGQEYTVTVVADQRKRLRAVVPVRVVLKRSVTLRGETHADAAVIELCRQIHIAQPFAGVVNVQCIKSLDGTVKPFEINPRVSTTSVLAIAAGVDWIQLASETAEYAEPGWLVPFTQFHVDRTQGAAA